MQKQFAGGSEESPAKELLIGSGQPAPFYLVTVTGVRKTHWPGRGDRGWAAGTVLLRRELKEEGDRGREVLLQQFPRRG